MVLEILLVMARPADADGAVQARYYVDEMI